MLQDLLAELACWGGPRPDAITPLALRADKAYSTQAHQAHLRARGVEAVIPGLQTKFAPGQAGRSRCAGVHKNRNVVERALTQFKNWRGIAARQGKHALVYRGGVVLAATLLWLSRLPRHVLDAEWQRVAGHSEIDWRLALELERQCVRRRQFDGAERHRRRPAGGRVVSRVAQWCLGEPNPVVDA